jgi:dTDP-4-dehydrorhamnose reductase
MKKILITGSEGMLGKALMQVAKAKGLRVVGADIRSKENNIDITNLDSVTSVIKRIRPDAIIHTAAYTDVDECELNLNKAYLINREGTNNVAKACKDTGAFLIYISTDFIFNGKKRMPYTEDDKPNPINEYGKSKLQGEERVKKLLEQYLIIRTSWLFGENGKNFVDTIIDKAKSGKSLKVVNDQKGSPTYSADLADAITELLLTTYNLQLTALHITNSGNCTWHEFAKEIIRIKAIKDVKIEPIVSDKTERAANRPKMSILDNTAYIKITGKALPSWQDALARYLKDAGKGIGKGEDFR